MTKSTKMKTPSLPDIMIQTEPILTNAPTHTTNAIYTKYNNSPDNRAEALLGVVNVNHPY
ncbi:hypothetical protein KS4_19790 [Poriferisphaera corsica]|uniref:Uncharacterized protein n=1 Tax=Poriferisphaera corsica TaxID=2528020 RepID=A0A517YUJ9_9BACT|nr:hypothetical protein KS4_19790 [Poriferisphaera corsica]